MKHLLYRSNNEVTKYLGGKKCWVEKRLLIQRQRADLEAGEEYCKNRIKFFNIF